MSILSRRVRFSDHFLSCANGDLTEDDLVRLAAALSDCSLEDDAHRIGEGLYFIEWLPEGARSNMHYRVWFVAEVAVPHIEVVALSRSDSANDPELEPTLVGIGTVHIARHIVRILFRLYKAWDRVSDDSDDIDFDDVEGM